MLMVGDSTKGGLSVDLTVSFQSILHEGGRLRGPHRSQREAISPGSLLYSVVVVDGLFSSLILLSAQIQRNPRVQLTAPSMCAWAALRQPGVKDSPDNNLQRFSLSDVNHREQDTRSTSTSSTWSTARTPSLVQPAGPEYQPGYRPRHPNLPLLDHCLNTAPAPTRVLGNKPPAQHTVPRRPPPTLPG
ncbi:unnamed protein product, partial [Pleuronectes platessa]